MKRSVTACEQSGRSDRDLRVPRIVRPDAQSPAAGQFSGAAGKFFEIWDGLARLPDFGHSFDSRSAARDILLVRVTGLATDPYGHD